MDNILYSSNSVYLCEDKYIDRYTALEKMIFSNDEKEVIEKIYWFYHGHKYPSDNQKIDESQIISFKKQLLNVFQDTLETVPGIENSPHFKTFFVCCCIYNKVKSMEFLMSFSKGRDPMLINFGLKVAVEKSSKDIIIFLLNCEFKPKYPFDLILAKAIENENLHLIEHLIKNEMGKSTFTHIKFAIHLCKTEALNLLLELPHEPIDLNKITSIVVCSGNVEILKVLTKHLKLTPSLCEKWITIACSIDDEQIVCHLLSSFESCFENHLMWFCVACICGSINVATYLKDLFKFKDDSHEQMFQMCKTRNASKIEK